MESVFVKPFALFEIFDRTFAARTRTLFTSEITREQYEWLKKISWKKPVEVDEKHRKWLEDLKLISDRQHDDATELEHDREIWKAASARIRATQLELMVAQACNMSCEYCYGSAGSYSNPGMMSEETAFAAMDMWKKQVDEVETPEKDEVGIVFFGGEPLMNYDLIVKCAERAENMFPGKELSFGMTTNLTLMTDEMLDFFAEHDFSIVISFDGPREYQKRRVLNDGRDSYDVVTAQIKKALKKLKKVTARATLYKTDDRQTVINEMESLGFESYQLTGASGNLGEKLARDDAAFGDMFTENMLTKGVYEFCALLKKRDEDSLRALLKNRELKREITAALNTLSMPKRFMSCGSGRIMTAVSHDGKIYPCHRFTGLCEYELGSIENGFTRGDFESHAMLENPKCRNCTIKYSCGEPCAHDCACDNPETKGVPAVFNAPEAYCSLMKKKFMLKAYLDAEVDMSTRDWLNEMGLLRLESLFALAAASV